jgi:hypothetical protein
MILRSTSSLEVSRLEVPAPPTLLSKRKIIGTRYLVKLPYCMYRYLSSSTIEKKKTPAVEIKTKKVYKI